MGAAYFFYKGKQKAEQNCLVLENHPIFGGEAKQNEFLVNGQRLMAPQGAWRMVFGHPLLNDLYRDVKLDISQFHYQEWDSNLKRLEFDRGFDIQLESLDVPSFGYFFDQKSPDGAPYWLRDFCHNLDKSPFPPEVQRDLKTCKYGMKKPPGKESLSGEDANRWLVNRPIFVTRAEHLKWCQ